jgi:glucan phosphoethanolaminetransferase (alkaline phosphatase superfamily)
MGIFVSMYITNSLLLVIIGLLLLVASIICVVLVSFFTKLRNYSFKNFLNIFAIFKTCYSFIFLRKQNLAKQGRSTASTRIFNKKTFDYTAHTEYREKQEIFEKKKKEEQKNQ